MPARLERGWWQPLTAAAAALVVDALYLAIIWHEGEGELTSGRVLFVSGCLAAAAVALAFGLFAAPKVRAGLFAGAAGLLGAWVILGAFSIGLLLVPAAVLAAFAAGDALTGAGREGVLGAASALALVAAGLLVT